MSYTAAEWRTIEPLARQAEEQAREHPERRDLFLCHAWDDRQGAARELCDLLVSLGATVWFSEKDVGLGKSLLREIDRGLANSRIGIVLVTPALLKSLAAEGIADKELSALLATDRVIPVAHGTTFEALRDVTPPGRAVRSEHQGLVDAGRRDEGRRCGGRRGRHLTGATTPRPIRCQASCCRCAAAQRPTHPRDD